MNEQGSDLRGRRYLAHLTDADLRLLAAVVHPAEDPGAGAAWLRQDPSDIETAIVDPAVFARLFPDEPDQVDPDDVLLHASSFLVFAVTIARTAEDLQRAAYIAEWSGPGERLPVFVSDELGALLHDPELRLFLAVLLASYTRVASGAVWVRTARGPRRRRFSELDLGRLAALVDVLPEDQHAAVYRRLGDLALFQTGVFPDHTARRAFQPVQVERLARAVRPSGSPSDAAERMLDALTVRGAVGLLEVLGGRWYRLAAQQGDARFAGPDQDLLETVAEHFDDVRRALNHLTDRYLLTQRTRWFPSVA